MTNYLRELFVEITNHCAQTCIHCSSCASSSHYAEIASADLRHLIDEALPLGLEQFTISGGEPLLHPDVMKLVAFLKSKNIKTSLYTCGVVYNSNSELCAVSSDCFEELASLQLDRIIFSLHGATATTQAYIAKQPKSFPLLMSSLGKAKRAGLRIELHTVPMRSNFDELESIIHLASEMGVEQVSLLRFVPQGRGDDSLMLTKEQIKQMQRLYTKWMCQYPNVKIRLGAPFNCVFLQNKKCTAGFDKLLISAHGEYFPCEAFKFLRGQRPSIYNTNLETVWEQDALLNEIRNTDIINISRCCTCELRTACRAGCAGQRFLKYGNLQGGPDPCCAHCVK